MGQLRPWGLGGDKAAMIEVHVGLFDKFKDMRKNRDDKKIERSVSLIKNSKAIREDRVAAIEYFKELGNLPVAVPALLQRFEYSLEHGINDTREKESCMEGVLAYGAPALPLVKEHLLKTSRIAWPIKILKALGDEAQVIDVLRAALDFGDVAFDQHKVDKNYDILCYLRDYKIPGLADQVAHFLRDPDERVRFAAAEVLVEQEDSSLAPLLEGFLGDDSAENTRLRQAAIEAFLRYQWSLKDPGRFAGGDVIDGVYVSDKGRLVVRG